MNKETRPATAINFYFLTAVAAIIFISTSATFVFFAKTNKIVNKKITETTEANRPANLDLIMIADETCKDCLDTKIVFEQIQKENIKINSNKTIDGNSAEAKQLIEQFSIDKLPTFLAKGELEKNKTLSVFFSKNGNVNNGTFIYRKINGPYKEVSSEKIKGRVNLILLTDITCNECYDVTQHENILKQFGMRPAGKVVDIKSSEGLNLKNKYKIKLLPTFVLTGDINEYPDFKKVWPQVGIVAKDGAYIFTTGVPFMGRYKDITTNKIITPEPAK